MLFESFQKKVQNSNDIGLYKTTAFGIDFGLCKVTKIDDDDDDDDDNDDDDDDDDDDATFSQFQLINQTSFFTSKM